MYHQYTYSLYIVQTSPECGLPAFLPAGKIISEYLLFPSY